MNPPRDLNAPPLEGGSFPPLIKRVCLSERESRKFGTFPTFFLPLLWSQFGAAARHQTSVCSSNVKEEVKSRSTFVNWFLRVPSSYTPVESLWDFWVSSTMGDVISSHLDEAKREMITGEECFVDVSFGVFCLRVCVSPLFPLYCPQLSMWKTAHSQGNDQKVVLSECFCDFPPYFSWPNVCSPGI